MAWPGKIVLHQITHSAGSGRVLDSELAPEFDERGRVEQLLDDRPLISWVNAVEVYHRVERDHGVLRGRRSARRIAHPVRAGSARHRRPFWK